MMWSSLTEGLRSLAGMVQPFSFNSLLAHLLKYLFPLFQTSVYALMALFYSDPSEKLKSPAIILRSNFSFRAFISSICCILGPEDSLLSRWTQFTPILKVFSLSFCANSTTAMRRDLSICEQSKGFLQKRQGQRERMRVPYQSIFILGMKYFWLKGVAASASINLGVTSWRQMKSAAVQLRILSMAGQRICGLCSSNQILYVSMVRYCGFQCNYLSFRLYLLVINGCLHRSSNYSGTRLAQQA